MTLQKQCLRLFVVGGVCFNWESRKNVSRLEANMTGTGLSKVKYDWHGSLKMSS